MPKGRYWTTREDEILFTCANKGAEGVRREIRWQLGRDRSLSAIRNRASDLSISLETYETCSSCGRIVKKLNSVTELCAVCHERYMAEQTQRRREALESAYDSRDLEAIRRYKKKRDAERQTISRIGRKMDAAFENSEEKPQVKAQEKLGNSGQSALF